MSISPLAGKLADPSLLVDVSRLVSSYYNETPDVSVPEQCVSFGTSGHRGCSTNKSFNEWHILAICQAICLFRTQRNINGPMFLGMDTHALSAPAFASALEVFAANDVELMIAENDEFTPTPAVSHAILTYNRDRKSGFADGVVITPSHNPPKFGGFKYNPPTGGPAEPMVTNWIEQIANAFLRNNMRFLKRISFEKALTAKTTHRHDFIGAYIRDLINVIDMDAIRDSKVSIAVDPLGGAGVHYWGRVGESYGLNLTVVNNVVDPTFRFMPLDWDGQIRMDPSSPYAMAGLIELKDRFDIVVACDTDHDRHGIITRSKGLLLPNHYLSAAIFYLFGHRPKWSSKSLIGKTVVSTQLIDRVAKSIGREIFETPVGFKWFVDGLLESTLGFCGEESAGASFLRIDGSVWTTDKDGIIAALLAAEITATTGRDPGEHYGDLIRDLGEPLNSLGESPATIEQKKILAGLEPDQLKMTQLAGEKIQQVFTHAPGNGAQMSGLKAVAENGWFAIRASGTENIYKIYAESFLGARHLQLIAEEAQAIVSEALSESI
ncbi:MAG: phosphoglucomutase (alpha-D-glucose-1,6-bisphosphate-dependent) [Proteobacteria bacterium]|nr:phosphoglucomutase (alpha-D-glucose-1,6-bisphosphate-dependent) [Pseudomonadota bacterium]